MADSSVAARPSARHWRSAAAGCSPAGWSSRPKLRLAVLSVGMWLSTAAAAGPEAGVVSAAQGDTWLIRDSFMSSPVRQSAAVRSGDRLMTGPDGRIELRLADAAAISIGPASEFRVDDYQYDQNRERSFFTLLRGTMRQVSGQIGKRNHDDYRLTTPTGVLAIRGTEFVASETVCPPAGCLPGSQAGLAVEVIQGRVAVTNSSGTVDVPAGSAVHLADAKAAPVFTAGPNRSPPATAPGGNGGSRGGSRGAGKSGSVGQAGPSSSAHIPNLY